MGPNETATTIRGGPRIIVIFDVKEGRQERFPGAASIGFSAATRVNLVSLTDYGANLGAHLFHTTYPGRYRSPFLGLRAAAGISKQCSFLTGTWL